MCKAVIFICSNEENPKKQHTKTLIQDFIAAQSGYQVTEKFCGHREEGEHLVNELMALLDRESPKYILVDHPASFEYALNCSPQEARKFAYQLSQRGLNVLFSEDSFFNCLEPRAAPETEKDELLDFVNGLKEIRRWEPDREYWTPDRKIHHCR